MRTTTRFELCQTHSAGFGDRERTAEFFCEGGPAVGKPCAPTLCRVWPGSDLFGPSATDESAADWVRNWSVNAVIPD
jgi:hypothetical protein